MARRGLSSKKMTGLFAVGPGDAAPAHVPIVGREDALRSLAEALARPSRAATVSGPIGVGKSRLVYEYSARRAAAGETVLLVDLTGVATVEDALALVAATMAGSAVDRTAPSLVVLDHCDAIGAIDPLAAALRARFAHAHVVTVCRARRTSSTTLELAPLRTSSSVDEPSEVARLLRAFIARWVARPHEHEASIAEAARVSEGVPLVLERMAERANTLSVEQMAERSPEIIAACAQLNRALDDAWDALAPAERDALACCAAFAGSFSLEAAEHALRDDEQARPLRTMQALRDAALLAIADDDAPAERRFTLLAPQRSLALRRADAAVIARARDRHARYFVTRGLSQDALAESRRSPDALAWMQRERRNLLAAAEHTLASRAEPELAASAVLVLQRTRTGRDAALYYELASRALAQDSARSTQCDLLRARANTARLLGRHRDALEDFGRARAIAEGLDDPRRLGRTLIDEAATHSDAGAIDEAERCFFAGLAHATAANDHAYCVTATTFLGYLALDRGQLDDALSLLTGALAAARAAFDPRREVTCLYCLGLVVHERGSLAEADDYYDQALALATTQRDAAHEGLAELMTGVLALERGDAQRASERTQSAFDRLDALNPPAATVALAYRGAALAALGLVARGRAALEAARDRAREHQAGPYLAVVDRLEALVEVAEARDAARMERAQRAKRLHESAVRRSADDSPSGSLDVRIARRVVARWMQEPTLALAGAGALVVARDGAWFALAGQPAVSLPAHGAARRVLKALAEARVTGATDGVSHEQIVAAGWPGQRVLAEAAALRVRAVIKQLRRAGLAELVVTLNGAYALSQQREVRLWSEEAPPR
jgi:predicted negative regulator of RcsB-dependent stress response